MNQELVHLRFDVTHYCHHCFSENINQLHPYEVIKQLNIMFQLATPQTLGNQWWFWNCYNLPETLPVYMAELDITSREAIGQGINKEVALLIETFKHPDNV